MRNLLPLFFLFFIIVGFTPGIAYIYPIFVVFFVFSVVYNIVFKPLKNTKTNPVARKSEQSNEVAKEIKEKYQTEDPYDTIATYDPALVQINRFDDMVSDSTVSIKLLNVPKRRQAEEVMMFLNEGEQVILEPPASNLATVAVYDRSKHLLGYIPKTKNNSVLSLIHQQRIIKAIIVELNRSMWNRTIVIELTYKSN